MKIKSIKPTSQYKHVAFGALRDNPSSVLTPDGFICVKWFDLIKTGAPTKHICFANGMELTCDYHHQLRMASGVTKYACDLNDGDMLEGYNNKPVAIIVKEGPLSDLYDIEIDSPHWYYTSGVVSHNSLFLANNAIQNSKLGKKVLYITLELSDLKSALRSLGALTGKPVNNKQLLQNNKVDMINIANQFRANGAGDIVVHEFPADSISVNEIDALMDQLKRDHAWIPDLVIIDYLELMISRKPDDNRTDYVRQKSVATQVRALAMEQNVCIFTATQTNRSGNLADSAEKGIDVTHIAESYGKAMAIDYLVSINQTEEEYKQAQGKDGLMNIGTAKLYIAKNRNGPKFISIPIKINYKTMAVTEMNN